MISTSVTLASELGVDGAQFQTDDAAAYGQQTIGDVLQFKRLIRIQDLRAVDVENRGHCGPGPRGDDGMDEFDLRNVVTPRDTYPIGRFEDGAAADPRDSTATAKCVEAA